MINALKEIARNFQNHKNVKFARKAIILMIKFASNVREIVRNALRMHVTNANKNLP
jgi:hypothetical protein